MMDDNKVSRQRICTMIHDAIMTFGIVYINGLHRLLCVNHPSADKPKGELIIHFVVVGWIHLMLVLVHLNIHKIYLKLKYGFRIIHNFSTIPNTFFR
jgi:hypothetical protein